MTFNYKALSLLLLTSIAMGAIAGGSCRSRCDCDKKERVFCKDTCCDKGICHKDCKADKPTLAFECCLSFEQVVNDQSVSRLETDKPKDVCGRFHICFAPDFSKAEYKLIITGGDLTDNREPVGAILALGGPCDTPDDLDRKKIVDLSGLIENGNGTCTKPTNPGCRRTSREFCCNGEITNKILKDAAAPGEVCTVAALFKKIKNCEVTVLVNGSNNCPTPNGTPQYGRDTGGLLRCHICC